MSYLGSLLEGLLVHSNQDDGMRSLSVFSRLLDFLDDILAGGEIDESGSTELLQAHLLLLLAGIDSDDPETHGFGVLLSKRSETTTSSDDRNGLAGASA